MSQLISLIYVSSATEFFSEADLPKILAISRKKNKEVGITGMLLYRDGGFIQAIEGPEDAVLNLYEKIQSDRRHTNIILLHQQPISKREFPTWEMGFRNIDSLSPLEQEGFSPFLTTPFTPEYFKDNPSPAYIMLRKFRDLQR